MNNMSQKIIAALREVAEMRGAELVSILDDKSVLLESGLDSLGFAILIAKLEEDLGYDPFVLMDEAVYPRTLGHLIAIYQRFAPL